MGLGFETPLWLLAIGLIGPLVWLYLRTRPRPPATVSSLFLWSQIPTAPTPRRRPRLPLLFFLQALLILASALAVAGPFRREAVPPGAPSDAVIVLDVSASMKARDGSATRFEHAREQASVRALELASGPQARRITVVAAGLAPRVVATGLEGPAAAQTIDALEAVDTPANMTAAVELAATLAGSKGSVDVFTDEPAEQIVLSRDARAASSIHRFGEGGENIAITNVRVQSSAFESSKPARLLVTVRSFSQADAELDLEIAPLAEGEPLIRKITLPAGTSQIVSFDQVPWKGAFTARVRANDDFEVDDLMYGYVPERRSVDVLLVTEDQRLSRELAWLGQRVGGFQVRTMAPKDYKPQERADVTLFDRFVPSLPPAGNVGYFAPSRGNPDVTTFDQASQVRLVEKREHEILEGVENPETLLGSQLVGLAPGELAPLLIGRSEGRDVAVAQAGIVGDRRIAVTGFRIDPGNLRSADGLPTLVFTLNLLSWLSPADAGMPLLRASGERLRAGSRSAAPIERLEGPDGSRALEPTEDATLERAGVYEAISGASSRKVLVSFVDTAESDIRRPPLGTESAKAVAPAVKPSPTEEPIWAKVSFLPICLAVILALMIAEWLALAASGPSGLKQRTAEE